MPAALNTDGTRPTLALVVLAAAASATGAAALAGWLGVFGAVLLSAALGGALAWRRRAATARGHCSPQIDALLAHVSDYVSILDERGLVRFQTPSVERLLGHLPEDRIGRSLLDLVHPDDLPAASSALECLLRARGATARVTARIRHRDGSWRVLETVARNLLDEPAIAGIVISSRDVTEQTHEQERQATRLAAARVLAECQECPDVPPRLIEAVCRCAGWDMGEVWCVDQAASLLRFKGLWHVPAVEVAEFERVSRETVLRRGEGLPGRVWAGGTVLLIPDVTRDPGFVRCAIAAKQGLHAAFALPVHSGGRVVATLTFFSRERREPDQALLDMMAEIGAQIGQFVDRAAAEGALRDSEERFHRLSEATSEGIVVHEGGLILDVNQSLMRLTGYSREELIGKNGIDLMPAEARDALRERVATGAEDPIEVLAQRRDGSTFWAEICSRTIGYRGGPARIVSLRDVSARRAADEALRKLSSAVEETADSVHITDKDGVIEYVNPAFERLTGYSRSEAVGRTPRILKSGRASPDFYRTLWDTILAGETFRGDFVNKNKSGELYVQEETITPIKDAQERITHFVSTGRDVTTRKRGEETLAKLSSVVEQAADAILITDKDGVIEYVNPAFERLTGYTREDVIGKTPRVLKSGQQEPAFFEELWQTIRAKRPFRGEFINRKKNGEIFFEHKTITPVLDAAGTITHFVSTGKDVTERKRAQAREATQFGVTRILAEAESLAAACSGLLRTICEGMVWDVGELWLVDPSGTHLTWQGAWQAGSLEGFEALSREMVFGRGEGLPGHVWELERPAWIPDVAQDEGFVRKAFAAGHGLHGAVAFPVRGSTRVNGVMAFLSARVREPEDSVLRVMDDIGRQIGQFIDRKRAEEEEARLQRAVERQALEWRLTFDAIASPILVLDATGRLVRLNRAAQQQTGRGYDDLIGQPVEAIASAPPWSTASALAREVAAGPGPRTAHVRDEQSGRSWDLAATTAAGLDPAEPIVIVVAADVTRIIELQETLRRSEHMSAMGTLVAGVAHEVRNPLFSISANLDVFEAELGGREDHREMLAVLRGEVDRLSGLMQALLDYGKPPSQELAEWRIEDVISQAVHACRPFSTRARVKVVADVRTGLPPLRMDRKRLVEVFQNLIENAIQHSPPRGRVRVRARLVQEAEQAWIETSVEDPGPGIAEQDLPHVFDPFFTRRRGGTGLGLSIAARIVDQHGGRISAQNRPEGGALMRVRLPVVPGS